MVIVPLPNLPGGYGAILTAGLKGFLSIVVVAGWVYILKAVTEFYLRKRLDRSGQF